MRTTDYTVRTFAPELWGQVDRFKTFFGASFPDAKPVETRAVSGVASHLNKALVLLSLAIRIAPALSIDKQQLNEKGFTPANHAIELAAVIESVFTELYSAVDCARIVVTARYPVRGMPDSTRKTFDRARKGELDTVLPSDLLAVLKDVPWYEPLMSLRDHLTHSDIGSVHEDHETGKVSYMHRGMGNHEKAMVIEDIFGHIQKTIDDVNGFLGKLFLHLNTLFRDVPIHQVCGIHQGKFLLREIRPEPVVTFNSGKCLSTAWIQIDGKPTCPMLCDAYWRATNQLV